MAISVSELYEDYENDFKRLEKEIDQQFTKSQEAPDGKELECLKAGDRLVSQADQALRQMEMEAKALPSEQRSTLDSTLKRYRADLLDRGKMLQDAKEMASRRSLLGDDGNGGAVIGKSAKDRERALGANDKMQQDSDKLRDARVQALESEQIGMEVMSDLKGQRDVIQRSRANMTEVGANYGTAKAMLEAMIWRAKANRLITLAALVFLLVFSGIAAWMLLGPGGGGGSTSPSSSSPNWPGTYSDSKHPGCKREISISGLNMNIVGTDGIPGPGCGAGDKQRDWALSAKLTSAEAKDVVIDFSPKGGPSNLHGTWDGNGIKFSDGGRWTKAR